MMYPDSFFWWVGGIMVMIGILGLVFLFATYIDSLTKRYGPDANKKDKEDDDDGAPKE